MAIELTEGQIKAIDIAQKLGVYRDKPKIGIIRGYAGTGKTFCIGYIQKIFGNNTFIRAITPTGKAAVRVRDSTGVDCSTIHRWLFKAKEVGGEIKFFRKTVEELEKPSANLIVIDEASMVDEELWEDVLPDACVQIHCNILCIGDPFQLPPVRKSDTGFGLLSPLFKFDYDVDLTEIHRQAKENPIIQASMFIREGNVKSAIHLINQGTRLSQQELIQNAITNNINGNGAIICHRNITRHLLNKLIRTKLKLPEEIAPGETILVLKNQYKLDFYNGETIRFTETLDSSYARVVKDSYSKTQISVTPLLVRIGEQEAVIFRESLSGLTDNFNGFALEKAAKQWKKEIPYLYANYGYALSCHKSQGSSWANILVVIENSLRLNQDEGRRWLYTALTRAENSACFYLGDIV